MASPMEQPSQPELGASHNTAPPASMAMPGDMPFNFSPFQASSMANMVPNGMFPPWYFSANPNWSWDGLVPAPLTPPNSIANLNRLPAPVQAQGDENAIEVHPNIGDSTDSRHPLMYTHEETSSTNIASKSPQTIATMLTPDIVLTPINLPERRDKLQLVQANGLTPTPSCPAKNLTHRSHALEPEGTSLLDKENIPPTPPELASVASILGKRGTTVPSEDQIIEVAGDDSDELPDSEDKPKKKKTKCHFRFLLVTTDPWAVDEAADSMAITAWFMRLDYLIANARYRGRPSPTLEELNVIKQRRSQHRGNIKKAARLFVVHAGNSAFQFITPKDAAGIKQNRDLVEALTKRGAYMYAHFATRQGMFDTPLLAQIIGKVYFDDGLKSEGLAFFGTNAEIPFTVVALVFAVILCAIDEWKTGRHDTKNIAFMKPLYEDSYKTHLKNLQNWEKHCAEKMNEPQIPIDFRKKLYAQGKLFAGITDDEPDADSENAEEDVFTAADFATNYYALPSA
ncbi:hypothetical protein EDD85DRAFT_787031 [Armillaria nabsnona]|nr:hypothetical protein EDD85DRAFT_787030 [Armillaria nabsnona]KAK0241316.1 hypothetical protein EDD85DRAFT_787031 [Armillaria nabsnona]